jgi:hypothetical protein
MTMSQKMEAAVAAMKNPSRFRAEADATVGDIRGVRDALVAQIKAGDLTPKQAREALAKLTAKAKEDLSVRAASYTTVPAHFDGIIRDALAAKQRAVRNAAGDELLRENNRLLRESILEQQIINRRAEFESQAAAVDTGRAAASNQPTVPGMLNYLEVSQGDPAAALWARRELGRLRLMTGNPEARDAIDRAVTQPGDVNERVVGQHLATLAGLNPNQRSEFIEQAVASGDSSRCVAAYRLVQETCQTSPEGSPWLPWMTSTIRALASDQFPAAAVEGVERFYTQTRYAESHAATVNLTAALDVADDLAAMKGVEAPSQGDLARNAFFADSGKPGQNFLTPQN